MSKNHDEDEIRRLLTRYASAIDKRDSNSLLRCFTDDATFIVSSEARLDETEAHGDLCYGPGWPALAGLFSTASSKFKITSHFLGQSSIAVNGQTAQSETYGLSFGIPADGGNLVIRGVRYLDRLRLEQTDWKIQQRKITLDWAANTPSHYSQHFSDRVPWSP